ncbi:MAG: hypothetical protein KJZ65_06675 [Phycisphaerales bacterium]|nr:hypothetical protein [Phycisphaerales bacterium]
MYPADTNENAGTMRHEALERMPRVGEIVHYFADSNVDRPMAAIVTAVWGPRCVNLVVFPDGSGSGTVRQKVGGMLQTSVSRTCCKTDVQVWDFA